MEQPILDPTIPYIGPIYGSKFTPGRMVRIQGTSPGVAYRFNIHLQCGPGVTPRDDVAVQVSVRLLDGCIILNSLQHGIWDDEQCGTVMPINRAEKFEIILMCDYSQYKVAINGQHYCEFPQRIHYDRITHLAIDGDVSIRQISYESVAGDGIGLTSGSGVAGVSGASASMPLSPDEDETEFEMIDSIPPSYGAAVVGNQRQPTSQPYNAGYPYAVGVSYSKEAPYPTTGRAYPTSGATYPTSGAAYPTSGVTYPTSGAAYPTSGAAYPTSAAPYPAAGATYPTSGAPYPAPPGVIYSTGAPGLPPPPPGAPVPLNFSRPVQRSGWQKCCGVCWGGVLSILIIIVIALKFAKTI